MTNICANCPTPNRRNGLPCGECPVCGTYWTPTQAHNGTGYGIVAITREDYQRWMRENGYGVQADGRTVPVPALSQGPNVITLCTATPPPKVEGTRFTFRGSK